MALRRALVVVDMSCEQMTRNIYAHKTVTHNTVKLAGASDIFDLRIDCRLWIADPQDSSLSWVYPQTGKTLFVPGSDGAALIPELRTTQLQFVPKNNYSCFANSPLLHLLREVDVTHVYVCGINTDYCVFATALDAFQHKFRTFVVEDAVTSCRGKAAHVEGLQNIVRHLGEGCLLSTDEVLKG